MQLVEMLDDQGAASVLAVWTDLVEGDDQRVAKFVEMPAEPLRRGARHQRPLHQGCAEGTRDRAVGADERVLLRQPQAAQLPHRIAVTAARGDDDLDAGCFGGMHGGEVSLADIAVRAQQCAVHVNRDHADGR